MKWIRRLITLTWISVLLSGAILVYLFNPTPVDLDFVWVQLNQVNVAVALLSAGLIGLVIGVLVTVGLLVWPHRRKR